MAWLKINNKIILFFSALLVLFMTGYLFFYFFSNKCLNLKCTSPLIVWPVSINGHLIKAEVAVTPQQQYRGLSNRLSLCTDCGLLFNFPEGRQQEFVMRDMKFPLDIIFINRGIITNIAANLAPEGSAPQNIYKSATATDQVLEVNAGYCATNNINVGDKMQINQR